jgi:hypothetical protein
MVGGNRAILEAAQEGRRLRLFEGTGGDVEYQGEFELDKAEPYYRTDAPETGEGPPRSVIVFRLRPIDTSPRPPRGLPARAAQTVVTTVPVEEHNTERMVVEPDREPYEAERRESKLVRLFKDFLEGQGHSVRRLQITPAGEAKPIYTDLYVDSLRLLVEAKGSTDRIAMRMAIGQLTDYRRFVGSDVRCALLVPSLPREDLLDLLAYADVAVYYPKNPEASTFAVLTPNRSAAVTATQAVQKAD